MVSERLEKILERQGNANSSLDATKSSTYTVWYSAKSGIIQDVGDGNPFPDKHHIKCISLKGDERGVLPKLANDGDHITNAILIVLNQIKRYRTETFNERYPT